MHTIEDMKTLLGETLGLGSRAAELQAGSPLLGSVAELDSAAVIHILTALEERYGISIDDEEIDAALFETVGSLASFVDRKLGR
ncbi:phosphopantetheine-binding protein [Herbaspirillum robiniae]|uniref:Acyl carrier protein n=1 Tax=Herbaspirillum robiniae TaxID=2014887 RepID=A0ABX2LTF1_9BURK|nr:phosphopantetheine-binding protein [Herbaspirillum robiniae]NUU01817.1 acyl carrier protein [Herbaspirillum robiniae]